MTKLTELPSQEAIEPFTVVEGPKAAAIIHRDGGYLITFSDERTVSPTVKCQTSIDLKLYADGTWEEL